ncbi:hypothetical protein [Pseudonocardia acidicola]|uniref:Uncharacterized protein n=1 Tax=Pseudonocardia acidicola TaxID=2724939 RepID=A0ABX1SDZ3_9PSEU|nr:hypothetical protein [Pseudonocardia acidicola]NMH99022.1 hypothetical protein [Pseudonocardia acidicola]
MKKYATGVENHAAGPTVSIQHRATLRHMADDGRRGRARSAPGDYRLLVVGTDLVNAGTVLSRRALE